MTTAKPIQSGSSQAVRLPKAFRLSTNKVSIFRRGDEVGLREKRPSLGEVLDPPLPWPDDIMREAMPNLSVQERKGL